MNILIKLSRKSRFVKSTLLIKKRNIKDLCFVCHETRSPATRPGLFAILTFKLEKISASPGSQASQNGFCKASHERSSTPSLRSRTPCAQNTKKYLFH